MQKINSTHQFILDTADFRPPWHKKYPYFWLVFSFWNLHQHVKNQPTDLFIYEIQNLSIRVSQYTVLESYDLNLTPIFNHASSSNICPSNFWLPWISTSCKKSDYFINSFSRYSQFWCSGTRVATYIFEKTRPIFFTQLLTSLNLFQHAKIRLLHDFVWDIYFWKILHSDWSRALWSLSQEPDFFQIWDLCRNIANNRNFHYIPNSGKIVAQIFNKFK